LDTLKAQYAKSVVYAYKNRSNYDYLNFIFSANSFNDALKRITYLKEYRNYREKQVETIKETQALIAQRQKQQLAKKETKNVALKNQSSQVVELSKQKNEKAKVVNELKSQEKELSKQLSAKKKKAEDLRKAIAAVIRREIEAAKKEAARVAEIEKNKTATALTTAGAKPTTTASGSTTKPVATPAKEKSFLTFNKEEAALAANFEQNKGRLPWPVDNGFVSIHFGLYTIEGTKIKGDNPGITISTQSAGQSVKTVFDGEVVAVHNLGDVQAVIIRHGKYFTSYSNLSAASVSKGTNVTKGQVIGRTGGADDGGGGQLDFMLLLENREQNPESWLKRGG
jgi:septal ring factor EnvC (AmiA/AmiB activator)